MSLEFEDSGSYSDKQFRRLRVKLPQTPEIVAFLKELQTLSDASISGRATLDLCGLDSNEPVVIIYGENRGWDREHRGHCF